MKREQRRQTLSGLTVRIHALEHRIENRQRLIAKDQVRLRKLREDYRQLAIQYAGSGDDIVIVPEAQ